MPQISDSKPYRIGRSKTGLGLFATKPIKRGTRIIRYKGTMLDCRKKEDDAVENKYLFQISDRWTVDGSVRSNVARYINHSCRPNAESDVRKRQKKIYIRAIKDIAPGDEINYDYGTEYFKSYLKPIGCKCDHCEAKRKKERAAKRAVGNGAAKAKKSAKAAKSKAAAGKSAKSSPAKPSSAKFSRAKTKTTSSRSKTAAGRARKAGKAKAGPAKANPVKARSAKAA